MASTHTALAAPLTDGAFEEGLTEVLRGLLYIPRQLSQVWLYDERGCRLFEKICELPEYYLTRTETAIMRSCAGEVAAHLGDQVALIEYGSGNSAKTRLLFDALGQLQHYLPIDIAASSLARAARMISHDYPRVSVHPLCADFTRRLDLPLSTLGSAQRLIYFPGSTIGNYTRADALRLLEAMRAQAGENGMALIGIDLCKERSLLERAYDDAEGVTAEFNLNALRHVNRRLGIGLDISRFRHRAVWVEPEQRIEMHLVSTSNQKLRIGATLIRMLRGDFIRSEYAHKYTLDSFASLAAQAGWRVRDSWSDAQRWFSVQLLAPS